LALLRVARVRFVMHFCGVRVVNLAVCGRAFDDPGLLFVREGIVVRRIVIGWFVGGFLAANFVCVIFFLLMRGSGVR
jgi:hypothetical protein